MKPCRHRLTIYTLLCLLSFIPQPIMADTIIELGIHFGGDEVIYEAYDDGGRDSIKAGEQFTFDFGRLYQISDSWESQITFGIKSDAIFDNELEVSWVRFPFNGLLFYRMKHARVGLGMTYHLAPELKGSGNASNLHEKYDNALGGLLEVDFIHSEKFLWGFRLTAIRYKSQDDGQMVDGNSIGFLIIAQL